MTPYRYGLPQLSGGLFLSMGGLEQSPVFREHGPLPDSAALVLLECEAGMHLLQRFYSGYARIARQHGIGLILDAPTWRANPERGACLGYGLPSLDKINRRAIDMLSTIRDWFEKGATRIVVSGSIGPRHDPALPAHAALPMSAEQAQDYHRRQIEIFARAGADMVTAFPLCHVDEAIGIARAAREAGLPAAVGFATDAGGRLPDGMPAGAAIEAVDAACNSGPAYYLINGVAPSALLRGLDGGPWLRRLRGVLAYGGMAGPADAMAAAARTDPLWLAENLRAWMTQLPWLSVVGCCAGDERQIEAVCEACLSTRARQPESRHRPPTRPGHGMASQPPW